MAGQAGMSKAMITTGYIRSGVTSELGIYIFTCMTSRGIIVCNVAIVVRVPSIS